MQTFMRKIILFSFIYLSSCTSYEIVDVQVLSSEEMEVVTLNKTIKFNKQIYSQGDSFEFRQLSDGSQLVLLSNKTNTSVAAGGAIGGPVMVIPVPTEMILGIIVDENLCATEDYYAAMDAPIGKIFDTSHRINTKGLDENIIWEPREFCFSKG